MTRPITQVISNHGVDILKREHGEVLRNLFGCCALLEIDEDGIQPHAGIPDARHAMSVYPHGKFGRDELLQHRLRVHMHRLYLTRGRNRRAGGVIVG